MERTIDDLFGPVAGNGSKASSFMKPPPIAKKIIEASSEEKKENTSASAVPFMKPPTKMFPTEPVTTKSDVNVPKPSTFTFKPAVPSAAVSAVKPSTETKPSISSNSSNQSTSTNTIKSSTSSIQSTSSTANQSTSTNTIKSSAPSNQSTSSVPLKASAPAFIIKSTPPMTSFKLQICLKDWFFVPIDGSLIAYGQRVDIDEMWKSDPVAIRIDQRTFLSSSQIQYHLIGPTKPPPSALQPPSFSDGLPALWKQLTIKP